MQSVNGLSHFNVWADSSPVHKKRFHEVHVCHLPLYLSVVYMWFSLILFDYQLRENQCVWSLLELIWISVKKTISDSTCIQTSQLSADAVRNGAAEISLRPHELNFRCLWLRTISLKNASLALFLLSLPHFMASTWSKLSCFVSLIRKRVVWGYTVLFQALMDMTLVCSSWKRDAMIRSSLC